MKRCRHPRKFVGHEDDGEQANFFLLLTYVHDYACVQAVHLYLFFTHC